MASLKRDPIINSIYRHLKEPIRLCLTHHYQRAVLVLLFSGIDSISHIAREKEEDIHFKTNFLKWCDKYLILKSQHTIITSEEWWSTRCGVLHSQSPFSNETRKGTARHIIYGFGNVEMPSKVDPILYNPDVATDMVIVNLEMLIEAFFVGVDQFLIDIFGSSDDKRKEEIEKRIKAMYIDIPAKPEAEQK